MSLHTIHMRCSGCRQLLRTYQQDAPIYLTMQYSDLPRCTACASPTGLLISYISDGTPKYPSSIGYVWHERDTEIETPGHEQGASADTEAISAHPHH